MKFRRGFRSSRYVVVSSISRTQSREYVSADSSPWNTTGGFADDIRGTFFRHSRVNDERRSFNTNISDLLTSSLSSRWTEFFPDTLGGARRMLHTI